MQQNQCGTCGKPTLSKTCIRCAELRKSDQEKTALDQEANKKTETAKKLEDTSSEQTLEKTENSEKIKENKETRKNSKNPYIILTLSILLSIFALSQADYTKVKNNMAAVFDKKPTKIEEKIVISAFPPYTSGKPSKQQAQDMEEKILTLQCGELHKPVIPISVAEVDTEGHTVLLGLKNKETKCEQDNYFIFDTNEKIKSLPIEIDSETFELYIVNIPIQGFVLNLDKKIKNKGAKKEKIYVNNTPSNTLEARKTLDRIEEKTDHMVINKKTGEIEEIVVNNQKLTKENICNTIILC